MQTAYSFLHKYKDDDITVRRNQTFLWNAWEIE